jgi:hypothetical protein
MHAPLIYLQPTCLRASQCLKYSVKTEKHSAKTLPSMTCWGPSSTKVSKNTFSYWLSTCCHSGGRRTKIQGGANKITWEPWFSSSPSPPIAMDKSYRCDERDLACRADGHHDKNRTKDGGVRKGPGEVGWHHIENGSAAETRQRADWFRCCRED